MKIHVIETEYFKLDGGAMFGVIPKSLWNKLNPADDNNMCSWAMRCMLIEDGDKKILIDTGIGDKQGEKFLSHFHPHGEDTLLSSLAVKGFQPEDITDVILTHLHFDHCGGAVTKDAKGNLVPQFPNAKYWSHKTHWDSAMKPNAREKASFLKENFVPLAEHGVMHFIEDANDDSVSKNIKFILSNGHTTAMMSPVINTGDQTIVYGADLMPAHYHLHLPYVMAYDIRPLVTLEEKSLFLREALEKDYVIFYEHDPRMIASTIHLNERNKYSVKQEVSHF